MHRRTWAALAVAVVVGLCPAARADVKPHPLIADGMVLQQGTKCNLWGTADPGEEVSAELATDGKGQDVGTKADQDGKWKLTLTTGKAGGPYTLTIKGKNTLTLKDVYVGEVWVCSGQSNMEWSVKATFNNPNSPEYQRFLEAAKNPKIRLFAVEHRVSETPVADVAVNTGNPGRVTGKWLECGPATLASFSAVAYYFGRDLQKALDVPVGLIHSSWGGTVAEAWTTREALESNPDLKYLLPRSPVQAGNPNQGTVLFNGMIAPLLPYSIKGAIWYQGESNAGRAWEYRTLFPTMIKSWRDAFGQGDFPFLFVQLAPFLATSTVPADTNWAELRDAQLYTSLKVPNTAQAVITDVGETSDIHPKRKEPVGARLALAARALAYHDKVESSGPVFREMTVEGNKAVLHFNHLGQGLEARGGLPLGFTIAGEDRKFYNAHAEIKGDAVVVWNDRVEKPVAVRFGWANYPLVDLWNKDGLPATPFRTDEFPLLTQSKK
jgi:sialate O-acetylesterase